jgi:trehalose 6-phosphate synthase
MLRDIRYAAPLLLLVVLFSLATLMVLDLATRRWFERDVALRAQLAVSGARDGFVQRMQSRDAESIRRLLAEITRDERILSGGFCSSDLQFFVSTYGYPENLGCADLAATMQDSSAPGGWKRSDQIVRFKGGREHIAAVPVRDEDEVIGFAVLVQDLSFVDRREGLAKQVLLAFFAVLGGAAFLLTLAASRFSFRRWTREMRKFLQGGKQQPEFQPILGDVRELVTRLAAEAAESNGNGHIWTPQRLKRVLTTLLHGEKVMVVANREPYIHQKGCDGSIEVVHPASGLVTALEPVMRACSGVWIAHGSGNADRHVVDRHDRVLVPPGNEAYALRRVWLSPEEEKGYYYGFSNEGIWPLCHLAHTRPVFRTGDWSAYKAVNRRFADAVCKEADSEDPIVLVQDYHFALAPRMIRERLPKATLLTFWHIPWPSSERLAICPWREEILDGLSGSSILGFHTQFHCNNFLEAVDRFMEARIDREQQAFVHLARPTLVRAYPISIEWPNHWAVSSPPASECRAMVFSELGLPPDALLGIGIDRIDYTKGIEERLLAVERLLERVPALRRRFRFAQLGAPSRTAIPRYRELNEKIERTAARINERFGRDGYRPIILLRATHEPPTVFRYYRAADVCYVSSLHDGMNLVAKEFVAARDDEQGVLVLSHFTGAARELAEALIVNPYDLDEASAALEAALTMGSDEQRDRMRAMRSLIAEFNVYRWAGRMLTDAARLRNKDRLFGRLTQVQKPVMELASGT